jgi:hypothetical protein
MMPLFQRQEALPYFGVSSRIKTESKESLLRLIFALQNANATIRPEVQRNINIAEERDEDLRTHWHFSNKDLAVLDGMQNLETQKADTNWAQLQQVLIDSSYLPIWKTSVDCMIAYQSINTENWRRAKRRALDILKQRDDAAMILEDIQDDVRAYLPQVYWGIVAKLQVLEQFVLVYNAQPKAIKGENIPPPEPLYIPYHLQWRSKKKPEKVKWNHIVWSKS